MFVSRNMVALSCHGKARVRSVCTVCTVSCTSRPAMGKCWVLNKSVFMGKYVAGNNGSYLNFHVKCPIFSSNFKQIWPKQTSDGSVYKQILIIEKLKIGKRGQKTERNGKSPLRRRRSRWTVVPWKKKKEERRKRGRRRMRRGRRRRRQIWIFSTDIIKVPNIKFYGNPPSGSRAD